MNTENIITPVSGLVRDHYKNEKNGPDLSPIFANGLIGFSMGVLTVFGIFAFKKYLKLLK